MNITESIEILKQGIKANYTNMFREKMGILHHPFIVPGSKSYNGCLWDWDSYFTNIALRQIAQSNPEYQHIQNLFEYEKGCILNFLEYTDFSGWMPILIDGSWDSIDEIRPQSDVRNANMHKPIIAQHAAFIVQQNHGNAEWLRSSMEKIFFFHNFYRNHYKHQATGLFFWANDIAIGVDNDPSTYYRPAKSSASILLNAMIYQEFLAAEYLSNALNLTEIAAHYRKDADNLLAAIREHCYDPWLGFYYSCDLNLLPREAVETHFSTGKWPLHAGQPRDWDCLIMRLGVWSGFLAMWANIATPEQAERMVIEHYRDEKTFNAPFGVRTLSKMEKMYNVRASGNPSSWLGPIWGISNYLTFAGLVQYGYTADAKSLAEKTIKLFATDFKRFGELHEYYQPENGEPILNRGFQNWNYLALNMANYLEGKEVITGFKGGI